jgi:hypothetical protein
MKVWHRRRRNPGLEERWQGQPGARPVPCREASAGPCSHGFAGDDPWLHGLGEQAQREGPAAGLGRLQPKIRWIFSNLLGLAES